MHVFVVPEIAEIEAHSNVIINKEGLRDIQIEGPRAHIVVADWQTRGVGDQATASRDRQIKINNLLIKQTHLAIKRNHNVVDAKIIVKPVVIRVGFMLLSKSDDSGTILQADREIVQLDR